MRKASETAAKPWAESSLGRAKPGQAVAAPLVCKAVGAG